MNVSVHDDWLMDDGTRIPIPELTDKQLSDAYQHIVDEESKAKRPVTMYRGSDPDDYRVRDALARAQRGRKRVLKYCEHWFARLEPELKKRGML